MRDKRGEAAFNTEPVHVEPVHGVGGSGAGAQTVGGAEGRVHTHLVCGHVGQRPADEKGERVWRRARHGVAVNER